jgi:hypothetical protein
MVQECINQSESSSYSKFYIQNLFNFVCDYKATPNNLGDALRQSLILYLRNMVCFNSPNYGVRMYQSVRVISVLVCLIHNKTPTLVSQVTHLQPVDNGRIHRQIYRCFLVLVAQLRISTMAE